MCKPGLEMLGATTDSCLLNLLRVLKNVDFKENL